MLQMKFQHIPEKALESLAFGMQYLYGRYDTLDAARQCRGLVAYFMQCITRR